MEKYKIIVLAKQVPDTRNVGKDAMKADGTINRGVLPAIFNPEDLNALEMALKIKDKYPKSEIKILTMGPPRAAEIIREGLYRGADGGVLITDKRFAGSDTLATSYAIAKTIDTVMPDFDIIFAGRQAIDGDTAQVGPQTAEKLNIAQITYAEKVEYVYEALSEKFSCGFPSKKKFIKVKRRLENGVETVKALLPALITVHSSADECRPRNAKCLMKYKYAKTKLELEKASDFEKKIVKNNSHLNIEILNVDDIGADVKFLGLSGSPTKVKTVENVVLQAKETKVLRDTDEDIENFTKELIANHTIG